MSTIATVVGANTLGLPAATAVPSGITSADAPVRIASVTLNVRDLDRVSRFYQDVVGLRPVELLAGRHKLGVAGRTLLELRRDPEASPADRRDAGLFHTAFLLPNRAALAGWLRHASEIQAPLEGASDHLVSEAVYLSDPEGNGIEVYRDRPSEEWTLDAAGFVEMATKRLDVASLMAEADGAAFQGMPEGTIVGHVHLQVGDLAKAEAFYAGMLGFDVACHYPGATFLGSGGYHHHIGTNVWNSRGAGVRPGRTTGLSEVHLLAEPQALSAVRERGQPGSLDTSNPRLEVVDPWGTRLVITAA
ncbi:VOC family protein [Aureimonas jatrophae]|uniref:Catechol 2,3-dioxygenase n=1 Tax=Aureimonas jatrophae TaxID=1166073 RepID=A0A1H0MZD2_9HYPH|nr:VOC family protein [Aureimonas jatrophae]MBB3952966.1 catechol 2,3-dioxygenase [Aureimonas jatrophae]SDO85732.1 catechol 2,3-dioxygenase [Aureimonas jatrophae]